MEPAEREQFTPSERSYSLDEVAQFLMNVLHVTKEVAQKWARRFENETPPSGYDPALFFSEIAFTYGIPVDKTVADKFSHLRIAPPVPIGDFVGTEWKEVSFVDIDARFQFQGSELADHRVWVVRSPHQGNFDLLLNDLSQKTSVAESKFLYRGVVSNSLVVRNLQNDFINVPETLRNEFGLGVYCTPNFKYALKFAARPQGGGGVVFIFNWTDEGGPLARTKKLFGAEWKDHVKRCVCEEIGDRFPGLPLPFRYENYNVLSGPIATYWPGIRLCQPPVPSNRTQVVIRFQAARDLLRPRLLAILYFE